MFPVRPLKDHATGTGRKQDSGAPGHDQPREKTEDQTIEAHRRKRHDQLGKALVENLKHNVQTHKPTT